jgi:hypothetical protein
MNNLLDLINAADPAAIAETNFQRIDASLAFMLQPSLDLTGNPNTVIGPPIAGTFVQYQLWVDSQLALWRCTAGGTPGAWIQIAPAIVNAPPVAVLPAVLPVNYLIRIPAQLWAELYWDGLQWLPVCPRNPGADSTNQTADSTIITADRL